MVCHQGSRVHVCHLGLLKCKDIVITNAVTLLFAKENDTISLYRQVCCRGWVGRTVVETCDTLSSEVCHRQYKVARLESCAPHPPPPPPPPPPIILNLSFYCGSGSQALSMIFCTVEGENILFDYCERSESWGQWLPVKDNESKAVTCPGHLPCSPLARQTSLWTTLSPLSSLISAPVSSNRVNLVNCVLWTEEKRNVKINFSLIFYPVILLSYFSRVNQGRQ